MTPTYPLRHHLWMVSVWSLLRTRQRSRLRDRGKWPVGLPLRIPQSCETRQKWRQWGPSNSYMQFIYSVYIALSELLEIGYSTIAPLMLPGTDTPSKGPGSTTEMLARLWWFVLPTLNSSFSQWVHNGPPCNGVCEIVVAAGTCSIQGAYGQCTNLPRQE